MNKGNLAILASTLDIGSHLKTNIITLSNNPVEVKLHRVDNRSRPLEIHALNCKGEHVVTKLLTKNRNDQGAHSCDMCSTLWNSSAIKAQREKLQRHHQQIFSQNSDDFLICTGGDLNWRPSQANITFKMLDSLPRVDLLHLTSNLVNITKSEYLICPGPIGELVHSPPIGLLLQKMLCQAG